MRLKNKIITARPIQRPDLAFWKEMFSDSQTKKQMYLPPDGDDEDLFHYFSQQDNYFSFTVIMDHKLVGGFAIRKETASMGTFGFVIHPNFRGQNLARKIILELEGTAKKMGLRTLRADVYTDNVQSLKTLRRAGFREFVWLEKNLI